MESVAAQLTTLMVMHSATAVAPGSRPWATTVMQRSRSVTMPTSLRRSSLSTTGIAPAPASRMRLAARCAVSDGTQQSGSFVSTCLTLMALLLRWRAIQRREEEQRGCQAHGADGISTTDRPPPNGDGRSAGSALLLGEL